VAELLSVVAAASFWLTLAMLLLLLLLLVWHACMPVYACMSYVLMCVNARAAEPR
jgi:hypothetical protein